MLFLENLEIYPQKILRGEVDNVNHGPYVEMCN